MPEFRLRRVAHELASDLRHREFEISRCLPPILEAKNLSSFRMLVKWDESWFVLEYEHSTKWSMVEGEMAGPVELRVTCWGL
jgi:hypothetical protein